LVEQPIRNRQVSGSSPLVGSIFLLFNPNYVAAPEFVTTAFCHRLQRLTEVVEFGMIEHPGRDLHV
jgi:hypothetical protein